MIQRAVQTRGQGPVFFALGWSCGAAGPPTLGNAGSPAGLPAPRPPFWGPPFCPLGLFGGPAPRPAPIRNARKKQPPQGPTPLAPSRPRKSPALKILPGFHWGGECSLGNVGCGGLWPGNLDAAPAGPAPMAQPAFFTGRRCGIGAHPLAAPRKRPACKSVSPDWAEAPAVFGPQPPPTTPLPEIPCNIQP